MKFIVIPIFWVIEQVIGVVAFGIVLAAWVIWNGGIESFRFHRLTSFVYEDVFNYKRQWEILKKRLWPDIAD